MPDLSIATGSTSQIIEFPVFDSSSGTGALLAGLNYNSGSLTAHYDLWGAAGAATAISLVTMTKGTWVSGGFVPVDASNMPGIYQLGIPNAALTGAQGVTIVIQGAANMVPVVLNIELQPSSAVSVAVKKNTALPKFAFLMTDNVNHAPKAGLGSGVTVTRSIDGGAFGAGTLANINELANGIYLVDFGAADLNGGVITLQAAAAGCDTTFVILATAQ